MNLYTQKRFERNVRAAMELRGDQRSAALRRAQIRRAITAAAVMADRTDTPTSKLEDYLTRIARTFGCESFDTLALTL